MALTVPAQTIAERWWSHVQYLADDKLEGRNTGSEGHRLAAQYAAEQFAQIGLRPAGKDGWFQPVPFETRQIDESGSSLTLIANGQERKLTLGKEAYISVRSEPKPAVRAPMVFVGHGIQSPEMDYDDLRGVDLKGKIAVVLTGAPRGWPGPLSAHMQAADVRWGALRRAGAIGIAIIPRVQTTPWVRSSAARLQAQMSARMPGLEEEGGQQLHIVINPLFADLFLEGTGHTLDELIKLSDGLTPLPHFPLNKELSAATLIKKGSLESQNVIGLLPGKKKEYVVVSAHIDHTGKMATFTGDGIFNGAMDNSSGVAAAIEVARQLKAAGPLERSVLFVLVTGEEKGLQGSRYFAKLPTVPRKRLVADCNMDMFMPLHALKGLTLLGVDESTLGDLARQVAAEFQLPVIPDPIPEQNRFTRSDQYSFVREGIPALAFKFGYTKGSPEEKIQLEWLRTRYHAVSDDLQQPVDKEAAARFTEYLAALVKKTANERNRPAWKKESFFRRFAR
ncbi:MAG TPA: M20/M25/M40 family metallo-hydrolase [Bryobacteraceae bacterium]|nr:M20/M25/M40 family metallo-hydrolase [Bryobacteraceae bacterium]